MDHTFKRKTRRESRGNVKPLTTTALSAILFTLRTKHAPRNIKYIPDIIVRSSVHLHRMYNAVHPSCRKERRSNRLNNSMDERRPARFNESLAYDRGERSVVTIASTFAVIHTIATKFEERKTDLRISQKKETLVAGDHPYGNEKKKNGYLASVGLVDAKIDQWRGERCAVVLSSRPVAGRGSASRRRWAVWSSSRATRASSRWQWSRAASSQLAQHPPWRSRSHRSRFRRRRLCRRPSRSRAPR